MSTVVKLTGWAPGNRLRVGSPTQSASTKGQETTIERVNALMKGGSGEARQPKAGKDDERVGLVVGTAELAHHFPQPLGLFGIAGDEIPWQLGNTRHPVLGRRERVAEGEAEIRRFPTI